MLRFSTLALPLASIALAEERFHHDINMDDLEAEFNANVASTTPSGAIVFPSGNKSNRYQSLDHLIKKLKNDAKAADTIPSGPGLRALQKEDMGLMNLYGCWCYF